MKKALLLSAALLLAGCGEESSSPNSLSDADVERLLWEAVDIEAGLHMMEDGRLITSNGSGPFSGWIKFQEESGKGLQQFKDGKANGPRLRWYKNGKLGEEEAWDNGQLVAVTVWMPNGDKCPNTKFKNGSGIVHAYWDDGQKFSQSSFKGGKESGLSTMWHENGQKSYEATYKDGQLDGLQTWWHENGQKQIEITYKDDENVDGSIKYWNSKGEEVETPEEAEE
jgi:antitoxin component YwqK of YwqJK toxin-antitoxin module